MGLKEPPQIITLPISTFILHKKRYKIDRTYQREAGTWRKTDEQYFIDTILRGFGMPPVFLHDKGNKKFIIDGQQRLNTIWRFRENKLELSDRYSGDIINDIKNRKNSGGADPRHYNELHSEWQDRFDRYPLPIIYLRDYNDEEIKDLFRRLQHGKPLIPGEILNAFPGHIVSAMRALGKHKFFTTVVAMGLKRYKHYHIAAQLIYLESEGIRDISPPYIYSFFEKNKNLGINSKICQRVSKSLNYLVSVFSNNKVPELGKVSWIITLYLLTAHLRENYAMGAQKGNLKTFFISFYQDVIDSASRKDKELIDFNLAIGRGTTSQANIKFRYDAMLRRFLRQYGPARRDENRFFTREQKTSIFRRGNEKCRVCGRKLTFGNTNTHFHHKDRYAEGGRTETDKGILVCQQCHLSKIHGSRTN